MYSGHNFGMSQWRIQAKNTQLALDKFIWTVLLNYRYERKFFLF